MSSKRSSSYVWIDSLLQAARCDGEDNEGFASDCGAATDAWLCSRDEFPRFVYLHALSKRAFSRASKYVSSLVSPHRLCWDSWEVPFTHHFERSVFIVPCDAGQPVLQPCCGVCKRSSKLDSILQHTRSYRAEEAGSFVQTLGGDRSRGVLLCV